MMLMPQILWPHDIQSHARTHARPPIRPFARCCTPVSLASTTNRSLRHIVTSPHRGRERSEAKRVSLVTTTRVFAFSAAAAAVWRATASLSIRNCQLLLMRRLSDQLHRSTQLSSYCSIARPHRRSRRRMVLKYARAHSDHFACDAVNTFRHLDSVHLCWSSPPVWEMRLKLLTMARASRKNACSLTPLVFFG